MRYRVDVVAELPRGAGAIPALERVVTCEEAFELRIPLPDTVALQCRQASLEGTGEVRLRRLVKEALRMRPSRIIVGEVRQEECLDLLIALNSGLPGMCSVRRQQCPQGSRQAVRSRGHRGAALIEWDGEDGRITLHGGETLGMMRASSKRPTASAEEAWTGTREALPRPNF